MKRNFSKLTGKAGFTLVELVVVIAVLAILAGVGAVAYNGYITYAKKGQDRALVGEILHAFELADYSDPSLFTDGETAHFYFTNSGAKVLKARNNEELTKSLEDALGNLAGLKLSYSGWNGADMSQISKYINSSAMQAIIAKEDSYLNQYLSEEDDPGTASFSGNMSELWSVVEDKIDAFSGGNPNTTYLAKIVDYSTNEKYTSDILEAWSKTGSEGAFPWYRESTENKDSLVSLGTSLARNYAFAIFVENKYSSQLTPKMEETLDGIKQTNGTTEVRTYYGACTDPEWEAIIADYTTNQARADALAYLALMEAGKTVIPTEEGADVSDGALRGKLSSVVGGISALLDKSTNLEEYTAFVNSLKDIEGSTVTFSMKKVNGVMVPTDFSDPDLNPRGSGSGSTASSGCTKENHSSGAEEVTFSGSSPNYTAEQTIELCRESGVTECKLTLIGTSHTTLLVTADNFENTNPDLVEFDYATTTVRIKGAGSGSATIKINIHSLPDKTYTFTVNVH